MDGYVQRMRRRAESPLVEKRDGAILIHTRKGLPAYEIALSAIGDESLLLGWIAHLCDKAWFNNERCHLLIQVAHEHWGKEVRY
jgi:hypothetical protein